jgi:pimeloyl-ACP methyl ester carboxylesterase
MAQTVEAISEQSESKPRRKHRVLRRLGKTICGLAALWLIAGFLATIPVVGDHSYWREMRAQPAEFGLQAQSVSFSSRDGIPLSAWYIAANGAPLGTVILAHGIDGNRSDMLTRAAFLVHAGYNALLVDLRDHGQSGGDYASPGYMEALDVLGALDYLERNGRQPPFIAMGHSYGAVAVLWAGAQSPQIDAVIADSPYISFEDMVAHATILLSEDPSRSFWERFGLRLAGFSVVEEAVVPIYYLRTGVWMSSHKANSLVAISRIGQRPILFIAGAKDKICPPADTEKMYQKALSPHKELLVVPGAEHDSTRRTDPQLYASTVLNFLSKLPSDNLQQKVPAQQ